MNNILVSVVIPSYKGANVVKRAVDSVLSQTYRNIEVVVVDDNGIGTEEQKRTSDIMRSYQGDDRVKYVCHERNKNGSAARNTGCANSSGDYIAYLDDDDVFLESKIERQVALLNSLPSDYAFVYCAHETYIGEKYVGRNHAVTSGSILFECLSHKCEIASSSILIRKVVVNDIGGWDESFQRHQDWEFVDRIAAEYKIMADDFIGFRRIVLKRNHAKTPEVSKQYRNHYLKKMSPYIHMLTEDQQIEVYVYNRMTVALDFIKSKRLWSFCKEVREIGYFPECVSFLIKRIKRKTKSK